jgi:hypothetical protein
MAIPRLKSMRTAKQLQLKRLPRKRCCGPDTFT